MTGRLASDYASPWHYPEKTKHTVSWQPFEFLFTSRIFFSYFYNKTLVYKKDKNGVALVDRDSVCPPSLDAPSPSVTSCRHLSRTVGNSWSKVWKPVCYRLGATLLCRTIIWWELGFTSGSSVKGRLESGCLISFLIAAFCFLYYLRTVASLQGLSCWTVSPICLLTQLLAEPLS